MAELLQYFSSFPAPTAQNLFLLVLSMLAVESAPSIRRLYMHFISKVSRKSLNSFYYALSHSKADCSGFMRITIRILLGITGSLTHESVFLCIDDTMVAKFGKKFEHASKLFDHAAHGGSCYLDGHCFVSLMLRVPVCVMGKIRYLAVPLGYRMWTGESSKLELAADMVRQAMPELKERHVFLLFDSWYAKKNLVCLKDEFQNVDIICNVRHDTALFDIPTRQPGKKGRPAKYGKQLDIQKDFMLSEEKYMGYHACCKKVITRLFGDAQVFAFVTAVSNDGARRLFISTCISGFHMNFPSQEDSMLQKVCAKTYEYAPLALYHLRWSIEVSYYEQKFFWSLGDYMVRSQKGIENFLSLITVAYGAMKILPYADKNFCSFQNSSVQEFRHELGSQINQQVFFATLAKNVESTIKSQAVYRWLKKALSAVGCYL